MLYEMQNKHLKAYIGKASSMSGSVEVILKTTSHHEIMLTVILTLCVCAVRELTDIEPRLLVCAQPYQRGLGP